MNSILKSACFSLEKKKIPSETEMKVFNKRELR